MNIPSLRDVAGTPEETDVEGMIDLPELKTEMLRMRITVSKVRHMLRTLLL
jgi:hypothetical protein